MCQFMGHQPNLSLRIHRLENYTRTIFRNLHLDFTLQSYIPVMPFSRPMARKICVHQQSGE